MTLPPGRKFSTYSGKLLTEVEVVFNFEIIIYAQEIAKIVSYMPCTLHLVSPNS